LKIELWNRERDDSREGAKHAKFGENSKIFLFAGLAQPKADPSSGGVLARKNFVEVVLLKR